MVLAAAYRFGEDRAESGSVRWVEHNGQYKQADYRGSRPDHRVLGRGELDPRDGQDDRSGKEHDHEATD
jgi:hypothetical protein